MGLRSHRCAWLIGGGGKTSLMTALARDLAGEGRQVLCTTTTRIAVDEAVGRLEVGADPRRLVDGLEPGEPLTVGRSVSPEGKLLGYAAEVVGALCGELGDDVDGSGGDRGERWVLVEADGSAGRPLKAHADHEPVVSERAGSVVVVVGLDVLGRPVVEAHVHRSGLLCQRLGVVAGERVTAEVVAGIVTHPRGYLARVPERAEVVVALCQAGGRSWEEAVAVAEALRQHDSAGRLGTIARVELRGSRLVEVL